MYCRSVMATAVLMMPLDCWRTSYSSIEAFTMSLRTLFLKLLLLASFTCTSQCVALSRGAELLQASPGDVHRTVDVHGTYMRATRAKDGSIIGVYEAADGANDVIRAVKSTNDGLSWKAIGTVANVLAEEHSIANPFVLQLPNGRLLVASRNHDRRSKNNYTMFRISVFGSDNGGATWSKLGNIDERRRDGVNGLWEPFLRVSRNGTIQAFYSSENNQNDQNNIMKISKDNGETWSKPIPVSGKDIRSRDGMAGVANVDDNGNVMYVLLQLQSCFTPLIANVLLDASSRVCRIMCSLLTMFFLMTTGLLGQSAAVCTRQKIIETQAHPML